MLGHTWVLPTRPGLRLAGLALDPWTPALDRLAHHHAAAVVRLHRESIPGQGGWVCERELWRRRGKAGWHLADGALPAPVPAGWQGIDQAWELVEVELHQKARPRVVAAVSAGPPFLRLCGLAAPDRRRRHRLPGTWGRSCGPSFPWPSRSACWPPRSTWPVGGRPSTQPRSSAPSARRSGGWSRPCAGPRRCGMTTSARSPSASKSTVTSAGPTAAAWSSSPDPCRGAPG
jgi:hypothetical protein